MVEYISLFHYKRVLEVQKTNYQAYNDLVEILMIQKKYNEAEFYLNESLRYIPNFADAYILYGDLLTETGRYDEAEKFYRSVFDMIEDKNLTSVKIPVNNQVPTDFNLEQNYPNPFNPVTTIAFNLPKENTITLKIYNTMGQEIKTLIANEIYQVGRHQVIWDATDMAGQQVSSGVYIYKLSAIYIMGDYKISIVI